MGYIRDDNPTWMFFLNEHCKGGRSPLSAVVPPYKPGHDRNCLLKSSFVQGDGRHSTNGQRARRRRDVGFSGNQTPSHHLHVQIAQRAAGSRTHRRPNRAECSQVHPGQQHLQVCVFKSD